MLISRQIYRAIGDRSYSNHEEYMSSSHVSRFWYGPHCPHKRGSSVLLYPPQTYRVYCESYRNKQESVWYPI